MEKVIIDTDVLVKQMIDSFVLLSHSNLDVCVFDFQIEIIKYWKLNLRISKIKRLIRGLKHTTDEGFALDELEYNQSKLNQELIQCIADLEILETNFELIFGTNLLSKLKLPYELRYSVNKFELEAIKLFKIKVLIVDKGEFEMVMTSIRSYEEVYATSLTKIELLNMLSYLCCGFRGIRFLLEKLKTEDKQNRKSNDWSNHHLQLIKI
jgi:hypothetical protein